MTGGILEENLNSLHLKEGRDYYHFNWLLQLRKKECATLMNLVVKSCKWWFVLFFTCTKLEMVAVAWKPWTTHRSVSQIWRYRKETLGRLQGHLRSTKHGVKTCLKTKHDLVGSLREEKFLSGSRNVWKRNKLMCLKSMSQPGRNTVASQRNGLKLQWNEQQRAKIPPRWCEKLIKSFRNLS